MDRRLRLPFELARWFALAAGLLLLAAFGLYGESVVDRALRPICPQGWWRTSEFWAHCAYPPMSIAKYAGMHVAGCVAALALIGLLAPRGRFAACVGVLALFLAAPVVWLLWHGFSWAACAALGGVALVAMVFSMGTRAVRPDAIRRAGA